MKILVIGATGMLGEPAARQLQAEGHTVHILSRNVEKARAKFGGAFTIVQGDVEQPDTLRRALAGCDGVHINLAGGPTPEAYDRIEHRGTANVAQAAAELGLQRLTYLSGFSVDATADFYSERAKWLAETAVQASGVPYTIFRAAWFMESLPLFIQNKRAVVIGKQTAPLHWLAAQDYARMVARAYLTPEAANKTLYVYGPEAYTMPQAVKQYQASVRSDTSYSQMPPWLLSLIAGLTRDAEMKDLAQFMKYTEKLQEGGSAEEANNLLGPPTTTLAEWCRAQAGQKAPALA